MNPLDPEGLVGKRLYFDTNAFIYLVEGLDPLGSAARTLFGLVDGRQCAGVTSDLALAECLVKPFELGLQAVADTYSRLFHDADLLTVSSVSREILIEGARIRATTRLSLADAIHAATARLTRCDAIVTNDRSFSKVAGLQIVLLGDVATSSG